MPRDAASRCSSVACGVHTTRNPRARTRRHISTSLLVTARWSASNPPTASNTSRRNAMQAPVTAATQRGCRSIPPYPGSSGAAPRNRCVAIAPGSSVMPACCTVPSGYTNRAPTTPISGRSAKATMFRNQRGSSTSISLFSSTRICPRATRAVALFIADQLNGPGWRRTRMRVSARNRASRRAVRRWRLSLSTMISSIAG